MSQSQRDQRRGVPLRAALAILLTVVALENAWLLLEITLWIPYLAAVYAYTIGAASYLSLRWLRFRGWNSTLALLGVTIAAAVWPCALFFLLVESMQHFPQWPEVRNAAWLLGPLVPYALLAVAGLWRRR